MSIDSPFGKSLGIIELAVVTPDILKVKCERTPIKGYVAFDGDHFVVTNTEKRGRKKTSLNSSEMILDADASLLYVWVRVVQLDGLPHRLGLTASIDRVSDAHLADLFRRLLRTGDTLIGSNFQEFDRIHVVALTNATDNHEDRRMFEVDGILGLEVLSD